jgi:hypothetical protein
VEWGCFRSSFSQSNPGQPSAAGAMLCLDGLYWAGPAVSNVEGDGAAGTLSIRAACSLRAEVGFTPNQRLVAMPQEASLN